MRALGSATAAAVLALVACAEPETAIVVEMDTNLEVPKEVDRFHVEVWTTMPEHIVETFDFRMGGPPTRRPARLGLRPAQLDRLPLVRIEATGLRESDVPGESPKVVVRSRVGVEFRRGEVRTVELWLVRACYADADAVTCPTNQVCNKAGVCVPIAGGQPPAALDAAPGHDAVSPGPAGPSTPDATMPADATQMADTSSPPGPPVMGDAAAPPPTPPASMDAAVVYDNRPQADAPAPEPPVKADAAPPPPPEKRANGAACQAPGDCQSGFCVAGLCCDGACADRCHSCRGDETGGANGRCTFVSAGRDPGNSCGVQERASCGTDGACDGRGACRLYGPDTECGAATCNGNTLTPRRMCTGAGACSPASPVSCGRFVCAGQACPTSCQSHDQCVQDSYCNGTQCVARKGLGSSCQSDRECDSGLGLGCVLGLCVKL